MDEWKVPFQSQIEKITQAAETAENKITLAESKTPTWPSTKHKITTVILTKFQAWLATINTLKQPVNIRPLQKQHTNLKRKWRSATWRHPTFLSIRLRSAILVIGITLIWVWIHRIVISLVILVILLIRAVAWIIMNWATILEYLQQVTLP